MNSYAVGVIGGGAAGSMAVLRVALNNDNAIFFTGNAKNKKRSRAKWVRSVENIPGFFKYARGIEDPVNETTSFIKESPFAPNITIRDKIGVEEITRSSNGEFIIRDDSGEKVKCKYIILCTGIMDVQPLLGGSMAKILPYANIQLVDYCIRCDGHRALNKEVCVVGSDSGAAWVAIMLKERYDCPRITILQNGHKNTYSQEVQNLLNQYSIGVNFRPVIDVKGDLKAKELHSFVLDDGEEISCGFGFVSLGIISYNELAKQVGATVDDRGLVVASGKGESSIPNFFVAGDIRAGIKKQIYTAWDSAVDSADEINSRIRKSRR